MNRFSSLLVFAIAGTVGFAGALAGAAPLPTLPGANDPAGAFPGASPPAAALANPGDGGLTAVMDHTRRGVVTVEREGRILGVGTVLANDGRVITALSPLGATDTADLKYADGTTVHARIGHRDKAWDLALLVPLSGRWVEGLQASEADPATAELKLFVPRAGKTAAVPAKMKGRIEARSKDGEAVSGMLDVESKGQNAPSAMVGSPLVDATGSVVGILVHACREADASSTCAPVVVGAPVSALRHFLVRTPLNAVPPSPWLGIVGAPDMSGNVRGVRVMAVAPQSPAEKGGLKTNTDRAHADLIAAVDGQPVDTPEKLAELISKHAIGESVKLLVLGGATAAAEANGKFREATVILRAAP